MKRLTDALDQYMNDYLNTYVEQKGLNPDNADDYIEDKEYLDMLENDLEDKGFSKEEAQSIVIRSLDKETAYKFMTYVILLCNSFENIDEMKKVIVDDLYWSLDDFTEDELNKIYKYSEQIDF